MEKFYFLFQPIVFLLVVLVIMLLNKIKPTVNYALLTIIILADSVLLNFPRENIAFHFFDTKYNWNGKILILLFSAICLFVLKKYLPKKSVGLTKNFNAGSYYPALKFTLFYLAIISIGSFFVQSSLPKTMDTADILWNTTILPDFSEELMERGILLVLLNNIFGKKWNFWGASVGDGFYLICILFAIKHGLFFNGFNKIQFIPFHFFRTLLISGLAFTWLKERTGNLIFPTIAHFGSEFILTITIAIILFFKQ